MEQEDEGEGFEASEVLDASVLIAGWCGITTVFGGIEYPPAIEKCLIIAPDKNDFSRAVEIARKLRSRGTPVGCVDIVIASMCLNRGLKIVTRDNDFSTIKEVERELEVKKVK